MVTPSCALTWRTLWVEEPGGLQSMGPQTEMTERLILFHPRGAVVKNLLANAGDTGSIPGLGRSLREGKGNPLQYSCLENYTVRGAWQATAHGVAKSQIRLSTHTHLYRCAICFTVYQFKCSSPLETSS